MKKYSIIIAILMVNWYLYISSCSTGGHIGTKHHKVSAGVQAH